MDKKRVKKIIEELRRDGALTANELKNRDIDLKKDLEGADLRCADLQGANLWRANLTNTKGLEK